MLDQSEGIRLFFKWLQMNRFFYLTGQRRFWPLVALTMSHCEPHFVILAVNYLAANGSSSLNLSGTLRGAFSLKVSGHFERLLESRSNGDQEDKFEIFEKHQIRHRSQQAGRSLDLKMESYYDHTVVIL